MIVSRSQTASSPLHFYIYAAYKNGWEEAV